MVCDLNDRGMLQLRLGLARLWCSQDLKMEWVCDIDNKGMLCSRFKLASDARVTEFH